ncbi:hypothetical protein GCM10010873_26670 [Cypionkella aquatica]|uniref:Peptidase S49 domain-containing protein n=1 Tax=Cypionkella aquatica TaxID=1756042 RepID=A0AA37X0A6_9RHOB|nr:S49 family peptidase [Cypionkella aquatica]GLS87693.1 hypothetical protein GCM10010873_26670 [Cypionkella aquatica]
MPHKIARILRGVSQSAWFIEPRKAEQILAVLELRAAGQPRAEFEGAIAARSLGQALRVGSKNLHVLRLHGTIMPRANMMMEMSGGTSMEQFQAAFREAAGDLEASAILIEVDSGGGMVDLVPETAALIRAAKRADRPIIAHVNTMAASAAYWLASAADEIVVTPSGSVGSIGVYMMHDDVSEMLKAEGIVRTFISEGPRKVEGNPFEPLGADARAALQAEVRYFYEMFTSDVAVARGVPVSVVRADPVSAEQHFGGGRTYPAHEAVRLGMADRVATFDETLARLSGSATGQRRRRADIERRRLALI